MGFSDLALNSSYLRGNVGDRIKAVFTYRLQVTSKITDGTVESFNFTVGGQCERSLGSFKDDGFAEGDTFDYFDATPTLIFSGTIVTITDTVITFTVSSGSQPLTVISTNDVAFRYNGTINGIAYTFGLPLTTESNTTTNRVTGLGQLYIGNLGGPTLDVLQDMIPTNYNFETGSLKVMSTTTGDIYTQEFTVEHIFVAIPYFLNNGDYLTALQFGSVPPAFQSGYLRYNNNIFLCTFPGQQNSNKVLADSSGGGSGRWFEQNANHLTSNYSVASIDYDVAPTLDPNQSTHVTIIVNSSGTAVNVNTRFHVFHAIAKIPTFVNSTQTLNERVAYDYFSGKLSDTGDGPATLIQGVTCTVLSSSSFQCEFDVVGLDLDLIPLGSKYIIGIGAADESLTIDTSDMLMMLADYQEYSNVTEDITGQITFGDMNLYDYDKPISGKPYTGTQDFLKVWNQDELLLETSFDIIKPLLLNKYTYPLLVSVKFHIEARKTDGTYFIIEGSEYQFPIVVTTNFNSAGFPVDNVHLSGVRNFNELSNSDFRIVRLWTAPGPSDEITSYSVLVGFKVNWQKWVQNIGSDVIFYDPSEPFDNLNNRTSNYSELNDYRIRAALTVGVQNYDVLKAKDIITEYKNCTIPLVVRDFGKDGSRTVWTDTAPTIKTYTEDGLTDLEGGLLYGANTLVVMTWTRNAATSMLVGDMVAMHRIEPDNSPTQDYIEYFGSLGNNIETQLGPVAGSSDLKITKVSTTVVTTKCLVDGTKITKGITYNISGRIWID